MYASIFILVVCIIIVIKINRSQTKIENYNRAKHLQSKFPNAFHEKFNTSLVSSAADYDYDELSRMASVSEWDLQCIEDRITAEKERRRREEEERKLNLAYDSLKRKYPHGAVIFENSYNGSRLRDDLIANEATLEKYEKMFEVKVNSIVSKDTMLDYLPGRVVSFDYLREEGGDKDSRRCYNGTNIPMVVMLDRDNQIVGFLSQSLAEKFGKGERLGHDVMAQFCQSQNDPTRTFWFLRKPVTSYTERSVEKNRLYALAHNAKADQILFRNYLSSNNISYLYHFTDRRNIDSIKAHGGLFSWKYCKDHNIAIPNPGGDVYSRALDSKHNLEDYVRLSFCDDHPMAYRLMKQGASIVLLQIKVDVAWLQETLFSDINAADNRHHHGATMEDLQRVDFNATKQHRVSRNDPKFKKHQAEVLVKTYIPLEYIVNINNPIPLSLYNTLGY